MSDHKLVLKNTLMLYLRMFITLAISLFTTRIVFNALGLSDLGIYNIVGGVLSLLGILNNTMAGAAQRFIAYDLGINDRDRTRRTFSALLTSQLALCLLVVLIAETVGLWFVNTHLNIQAEKMYAANWVYQVAVISMVLGIVKAPFSASIVAHEKMSIYAYFSIIDVCIKLLIVVALLYIPDNKLIVYALLLLLSTLIDFGITIGYALKKLEESNFRISFEKEKFKEIFSFSGWTLVGQTTIIANEQVVNIFINWGFGTIANGARDIAGRVNGMVAQFVSQFQTALSPPLIKSYASGDYADMRFLMFMGCKVSFILMFLLSFPLILETQTIFQLWLGEVPEYTVGFLRLILINTLVDSMTGPIIKCIQATGRVKKQQIITSIILIMIIPLSYFILKLGVPPYYVYFASITMNLAALFARVYLLSNMVPISFGQFFKSAFAPCCIGVVPAILIMGIVKHFEPNPTVWIALINVIISFLLAIGFLYLITLNSAEKVAVRKIGTKLTAKFHAK